MHPTRIYLTGFMGSGKSTLGPIVANVLGYTFQDLDAAIVERAGKPISAIFAEEGEAAFRALEATLLRETERDKEAVIALGGGALTFEENLRWALNHGVVVYLKVPLEELIERLIHGRSVRPLLLDAKGEVLPYDLLFEKINAMMERREPYYQRAHIVLEMDEHRVGSAVDEVIKALRQYGKAFS